MMLVKFKIFIIENHVCKILTIIIFCSLMYSVLISLKLLSSKTHKDQN